MQASLIQLHLELTQRQLRSALGLGSIGWIWLLLTPLLLLSVYGFVFGVIFQARAPAELSVPFTAWLAVGLWPWLAFSDGSLRGAHGVRQHSSLVAKVAMPRVILSASTQTAAFLLQLVGFAVVLLALRVLGVDLFLTSVPHVVFLLASLYFFSLGLALALSAVLVFIRDLEQFLPTFFMFWFFLTPILYAPDLLPPGAEKWLALNPMTWWVEEIRAALFYGKWFPGYVSLGLLAGSFLMLWLGRKIFDRLSPHFEDFL